jgi:hypothetical protein
MVTIAVLMVCCLSCQQSLCLFPFPGIACRGTLPLTHTNSTSAALFSPSPLPHPNHCHHQGLSHGYDGRLLFKDVDLEIGQGERIAIIGPNG